MKLASPIPNRSFRAYNKWMQNSQSRRLILLSAIVSFLIVPLSANAQDADKRGRKYTPPPVTAHVAVAVIKDANGKPIENAAVVFHMIGEEGKGNMELKTNEEGKAIIDVIPIGDTLRLQVIASGFQTYGEDYKIDTDSKDIVVRLKRPARQYSTYEHSANSAQNGNQKPSDPQTPPKQ